MSKHTLSPSDPPILLAGLIAARQCGDKPLERYFARQLRERCGIKVGFAADLKQGDRHASRVADKR